MKFVKIDSKLYCGDKVDISKLKDGWYIFPYGKPSSGPYKSFVAAKKHVEDAE